MSIHKHFAVWFIFGVGLALGVFTAVLAFQFGQKHFNLPPSIGVPTDITMLTEEEFERQFRCPETFVDEDQSKTAVDDMLKWYGAHNASVTLMDIVNFRMKLLTDHKCQVTLRNIRNAKR